MIPDVVKNKLPADIPATRALSTIYKAVSKATTDALAGDVRGYAESSNWATLDTTVVKPTIALTIEKRVGLNATVVHD